MGFKCCHHSKRLKWSMNNQPLFFLMPFMLVKLLLAAKAADYQQLLPSLSQQLRRGHFPAGPLGTGPGLTLSDPDCGSRLDLLRPFPRARRPHCRFWSIQYLCFSVGSRSHLQTSGENLKVEALTLESLPHKVIIIK